MTRPGTRKRQKKAVYSKKTVLLIAGLVLCACAVIIGINVMFYRTISKYDPDIIISGVKIGETDVSGMNMDQAKEAVMQAAQDYSARKLILTLEDGQQAEATLGELGISVPDLESAVKKAVDYGKEGSMAACYKILKSAEKGENNKVFPITFAVTEESAASVLNERLGGFLPQPENAKMTQSDGAGVVTEDVPCKRVDVKKTVESINHEIVDGKTPDGEVVVVDTEEYEADITAADLEGITDLLGTYSTYYGESDSGRKMNVESGAVHIGGTLMGPGEEVSADKLMAPYTEENGYGMAASYENRQVVESMGGGICQVSTTLYNALLLAELEITERYAHSMQVSYVEPSMDAAIADDVKDLKFRNNMETAVYIESVCSEGTLTFNIYGKETRPENRTIEYISEELGIVESDETLYVATEEAIGTMYTQNNGKTGLEAQLWKVVYEDGEEVSRDTVNYSYYMASGKTIAVGTFSDNAEDSAKINAAIETQNEDTIKAVIEEIQNSESGENSESSGDGE